jgi:hypothetical protein
LDVENVLGRGAFGKILNFFDIFTAQQSKLSNVEWKEQEGSEISKGSIDFK